MVETSRIRKIVADIGGFVKDLEDFATHLRSDNDIYNFLKGLSHSVHGSCSCFLMFFRAGWELEVEVLAQCRSISIILKSFDFFVTGIFFITSDSQN